VGATSHPIRPLDLNAGMSGSPHYEIYKDDGGSWRWRLLDSNWIKVGSSGESFYDRSSALRAVHNAKTAAAEAERVWDKEAGKFIDL
jgi:uncharacterized protein YegP (UPF0339 family)